ncbi:Small integral membrane protein 14, partial [Pseudolycoriella hygida]
MADDNFDACECIWSHELAMRRLLSMLRQGQSHCTDTECVDLITPRNVSNESTEGNFMLLTMLTMLALVLFIFRPMERRQSPNTNKISGNGE